MVEAAGCLAAAPGTPVLLVYADEALPDPYSELDEDAGAPPLAAALLLGPERGGEAGELVELAVERGGGGRASTTGQALDALRFLASGEAARSSPGAQLALHWRRLA
jgi:Beta-ketoacyl synthase, N-terminal domain